MRREDRKRLMASDAVVDEMRRDASHDAGKAPTVPIRSCADNLVEGGLARRRGGKRNGSRHLLTLGLNGKIAPPRSAMETRHPYRHQRQG